MRGQQIFRKKKLIEMMGFNPYGVWWLPLLEFFPLTLLRFSAHTDEFQTDLT
jgi:hypothetical protein